MVSNLLVFYQFICNHLNEYNQIGVIYTDFSKAFDILDHEIVLTKLLSLDLPANYVFKLRHTLMADLTRYAMADLSLSHIYLRSTTRPESWTPTFFYNYQRCCELCILFNINLRRRRKIVSTN